MTQIHTYTPHMKFYHNGTRHQEQLPSTSIYEKMLASINF